MVSSPITLWQIDGETLETVTVFILATPDAIVSMNSSAHSHLCSFTYAFPISTNIL